MIDREKAKHIGYGQGNGKVCHVIIGSKSKPITLCDFKPIIAEENKNFDSVTCKKCQRLKFYKNLEEIEIGAMIDRDEKKKQPPKNNINPTEEVPKEVPNEEKPKEEAKEIPKEKTDIPKIDKKTAEKAIQENESQTKEKPEKKPKEQEQTKFEFEKPENILSMDSMEINKTVSQIEGQFIGLKNLNNKYRIIHKASERIFFDGISEKHIIEILIALNENKGVFWNGKGSPEGYYLTTIRQIFSNAFKECDSKEPKTLEDLAEQKAEQIEKAKKKALVAAQVASGKNPYTLPRRKKKNPSIKRRSKPKAKIKPKSNLSLPKIKRRDKKATTIKRRKPKNGFRENSFGKEILDFIKKQGSIPKKDVLKHIIEKFSITPKEANFQFGKVIRISVRQKGIKINIILNGKNAKGYDDLYSIDE